MRGAALNQTVSVSSSACHADRLASLGIRQSPRGESVTCCEAPDDAALVACRALGKALAE